MASRFNQRGSGLMKACLIWLAAAALTAAGTGDQPALHPILEPVFQQELNASTNSVLAVSDEIALLVDGKESYPVRWRMLENARAYIHLTTMYIFADETTERLADVLIRKKNEGRRRQADRLWHLRAGQPVLLQKDAQGWRRSQDVQLRLGRAVACAYAPPILETPPARQVPRRRRRRSADRRHELERALRARRHRPRRHLA